MRIAQRYIPFKILLALDNSPHSAVTVDLLTHITWPLDTSVYLLTTVPDQLPLMETSPELRRDVDETVELDRWRDWAATKIFVTQTTEALQAHHLNVERTEICDGQLADITSERAKTLSIDLVVIGAGDIGNTSELQPDIAAHKLAQIVRRSVLVIRPSEQIRPLTTILAVDGSPEAWRAVEFVCTLSLSDWAKVTVVSVVEEEAHCPVGAVPAGHYAPTTAPWLPEPGTAEAYVAKVTRRLQNCGVQVRRSMRFGHPANEILSAAQEQDAALIIVGARNQNRINAFDVSGVSQTVIKHAPCSVLMVR